MNVVDVHAYQPRPTRHIVERIALWQFFCLFAAVGLIWFANASANRHGDSARSSKQTPWEYAALYTTIVLSAGLASILPVYLYHRRYAHKQVTICSYCRQVQVDDGEWTAIEAYFADKTHATYSHGVCPACQERVMTAYRTSHGTSNGTEIPAASSAL